MTDPHSCRRAPPAPIRSPVVHFAHRKARQTWGTGSGMSMSRPLEPGIGPPDDGIPAAAPGPGAPEPAEGFGVGGEEPDLGPPGDHADPPDDPPDPHRDDVPFRTPDPREMRRI